MLGAGTAIKSSVTRRLAATRQSTNASSSRRDRNFLGVVDVATVVVGDGIATTRRFYSRDNNNFDCQCQRLTQSYYTFS